MEKLQSALERARQKRQTSQNETPAQARAAEGSEKQGASTAPVTEIDARWAEIPQMEIDNKLLHQKRVVALQPSAEANPFDVLRTKCLLRMRQNGWKRLAITSPSPDCGKTVTSCNLAAAMSRQTDMRTLLFDFDLRRPSIADTFGQPSAPSVSDMLRGDIEFSAQARRIKSNVAVSMQQMPVDDPSRLLLHEDSMALLSQIEQDYEADMMLFDMPPVLTGDETRGFLQHVDCALIVVRADVTKTAQIDLAEREIAEQTNVLGVMLNQCRHVEYTLSDRYY